MKGRTVLITNWKIDGRTGTELFVRDVARGLLAAGHRPVLYSTRLGQLAAEIRKETVPVVDVLGKLSAVPDVIHGQHVNETLTALLHFPDTPAIYFCHDWYHKEDRPPRFPRVLGYAAVDEQCFDKLVCEYGVPEQRARVIGQFVDLERFQTRDALPQRPKRAAILCNHTKENEHLRAARAACAKHGVTLDVYGAGVGNVSERPEQTLRNYDIVFAKGRAAAEAAAVGAAVVIYWWRQLGPLVKSDRLEEIRQGGFGRRSMGPLLDAEEFGRGLEAVLEQYDPIDANEVTRQIRGTAGREAAVGQLLELYEAAIAEQAVAPPDRQLEGQAAAAYLRELSVAYEEHREHIYNSAPYRLTERLRGLPIVGRVSRVMARRLADQLDGKAKPGK